MPMEFNHERSQSKDRGSERSQSKDRGSERSRSLSSVERGSAREDIIGEKIDNKENKREKLVNTWKDDVSKIEKERDEKIREINIRYNNIITEYEDAKTEKIVGGINALQLQVHTTDEIKEAGEIAVNNVMELHTQLEYDHREIIQGINERRDQELIEAIDAHKLRIDNTDKFYIRSVKALDSELDSLDKEYDDANAKSIFSGNNDPLRWGR